MGFIREDILYYSNLKAFIKKKKIEFLNFSQESLATISRIHFVQEIYFLILFDKHTSFYSSLYLAVTKIEG